MAEVESTASLRGSSYSGGLHLFAQSANRRWWVTSLTLATVAGFLGLLLEHRAEPSSSADIALTTVTAGVVIPAFCLALVVRVVPGHLEQATSALARHGADRRWLLLGFSTSLVTSTAVVGASLALLTRALGGSLVASGASDLLTCAWIGGLTGMIYAAWFLLGSTFGRLGKGRWLALVVDWVFGVGSGVLALPWPRAHVRSLLGGAPTAGLEQPLSSGLLLVLVAVYVTLAITRCPR